ncbi:MAG: hypothetical protein H7326_03190 [Bdellovibrionaceae bacterium]|nr:hypothetical protein [Pseudobdellovibrionaceae bacterium]
MFMKPLWISSLIALSLQLAACNQYSDGLVGDYQETSKCPANGCANAAASENYISMASSTSSLSVVGANPVTLGGDCNTSTYPTNVINATVTYQTSGAPVTAAVSSNNGASATPACKKGRFDVTVDTRNLPAGNVYTLKLELVAFDTANAPHRNTASGVKTVTIRK